MYLVLSTYLKNDLLRKFSQIKDESNNLSVTSITNFTFYVNPVAFVGRILVGIPNGIPMSSTPLTKFWPEKLKNKTDSSK